MSMLPKEYEVPQKSGNYMKFQDGENRFRILAAPILGYEWWTEDNTGSRKPKRITMETKITADEVDPQEVKHFWAMPVYNYAVEKVQILEITQKSLQKYLRALDRDEDWGDFTGYDIVVTKSGQKLETEYHLNPKPAKKLDPGIIAMYEAMNINLQALYTNDDPFASSDAEAKKLADDAEKAGL